MKRLIFPLAILLSIFFLYESLPEPNLPTKSTPFILFSNKTGDDFREILTQAMKQANKSITILIYSLKDPKILNTLKEKAEEGVSITLIVDSKASQGIHNLLGQNIHTFYRKSKGLMHLKLVTIDEKESWISTANFSTDSLKYQPNLLAGIRNKKISRFIEQKATQLQTIGKIEALPKFHADRLEFSFFPDDPEGPQKLKSLIQTAEKNLKVAMYTFTRQDLAEEIVAAKKRGVRVKVILDGRQSKNTNRKIVQYLQKNQIPITLSKGPTLLHHKFVWIDKKTLAFGSANWTAAAFTKNEDCLLVITPLSQEENQLLKRSWKKIKQ